MLLNMCCTQKCLYGKSSFNAWAADMSASTFSTFLNKLTINSIYYVYAQKYVHTYVM